jgi:hypothetical protein
MLASPTTATRERDLFSFYSFNAVSEKYCGPQLIFGPGDLVRRLSGSRSNRVASPRIFFSSIEFSVYQCSRMFEPLDRSP